MKICHKPIILLISILFFQMLNAVEGELDATFNPSGTPPGTVVTSIASSNDTAFGVAIHSDQKIVLAGLTTDPISGQQVFGLIRHNHDGTLDTSFGSGGKVVTPQVPGASSSRANDVAIQADGKIVAVGIASIGGQDEVVVARYCSNGMLDDGINCGSGFGTGGFATTSGPADINSGAANAVLIQPDGKIIIGGSGNAIGGPTTFVLIRYNTDGTPDATFGLVGIVTTFITGSSGVEISDLAFDPVTGFIVAIGRSNRAAGTTQFAVARYSIIDGSLDPLFNAGQLASLTTQQGVVVTEVPTSSPGTAIAFAGKVYPDGRIVAGGSVTALNQDFALVRYLPTGFLDLSFGNNGQVVTDFAPLTINEIIRGVALQSDGKIIVSGTVETLSEHQFAVGRYNMDGSPDNTFNPFGLFPGFNFVTINNNSSEGFDLALQADGKIVVVGSVTSNPLDFGAARFNGIPIPSPCPLLQNPRSTITQAIMSKYCNC